MIIYFTGTGNSQYIAEAIARGCRDQAVSANSYIKAGTRGVFSSEKPYVFVFPVYLSIMPAIFRTFILRSSFSGNRNAYFVPTCASADGSVPNAAIQLCRETGYFHYMGCCKVKMPQNYLLLFHMFDQDQIEERLKEAGTTVRKICRAIERGKHFPEKPVSRIEYQATGLVEKWYNARFTRTDPFYATDACIGCGLCEKTCPVNAIELTKEKRPVWVQKTCVHCMACINRCPKQAIEYGKRTTGKSRYVCKGE